MLKAESDPQIIHIIRRLRRLTQIRSTGYKNYPQITQISAD
jgi:hypothetical protein